MPQKALDPEVVQKARELRAEGRSLADIAAELQISQGSASNATRGIKKTSVEKEARRKENGGAGPVQAGRYDEPNTTELANELRRAEITEKLQMIESRRGDRDFPAPLRADRITGSQVSS